MRTNEHRKVYGKVELWDVHQEKERARERERESKDSLNKQNQEFIKQGRETRNNEMCREIDSEIEISI